MGVNSYWVVGGLGAEVVEETNAGYVALSKRRKRNQKIVRDLSVGFSGGVLWRAVASGTRGWHRE